MKVLISIPDNFVRSDFLDAGSIKLLEENFEVIYNDLGRNYTQDEMKEMLTKVDIVITGWGFASCIDGPLHGNTNLKMIAHTAGSVGDLVDQEAYDLGIKVVSGNRLFAESVAEGTIAYIMSALRRIPTEIQGMKNGHFHHPTVEAEGGTRGILDREIGLVGFGMITKDVITLLKPFRCKFKIYSQYPIDPEYLAANNATQVADLHEIFSTCSVVSLHSALNDKTRGMIKREHFECMQKNAVFINTARGGVIVQSDLEEVLQERPDLYAVLDVFTPEPPAPDCVLRKLDNAYLLPHRGGPTRDRRPYIGRAVVEDIVRFSKGEPLKLEITREYSSRMTKQTH